MRILYTIIGLLLTVFFLSSCGAPQKRLSKNPANLHDNFVKLNPDLVTNEELLIIEELKSKATGPLKKAFILEEKHREITLKELNFLLNILKTRFIRREISKEEFEQRLYMRIDRDTEIIDSFNGLLEKIKPNDKDSALYLCKENRLFPIISSSQEIIENHIDDLIQGKMPMNFKKSLYDIITLETDKGGEILAGSFKPTCLKGVIITMLVELQGSDSSVSDIEVPVRNGIEWVDYSLLFHTVPITDKIVKTRVHPDFESFTYYYKDKLSPPHGELGFPHSGYYMGGKYARNPQKKISNPEDCSSWVSKILGAKYNITTYCLMQFFRIKSRYGLSDKSWVNRDEFKYLETILEPIEITNMQEDVKPGDILCIRRYKNKEKKVDRSSYGDSGHMAIALFVTDTHILAIACTRDAPIMEGIGIQKISLKAEENSDIMFLRYKGEG